MVLNRKIVVQQKMIKKWLNILNFYIYAIVVFLIVYLTNKTISLAVQRIRNKETNLLIILTHQKYNKKNRLIRIVSKYKMHVTECLKNHSYLRRYLFYI